MAVFEQARKAGNAAETDPKDEAQDDPFGEQAGEDAPDLEILYRDVALKAVRDDKTVMARLAGEGALWGYLLKIIEGALPGSLEDRFGKARDLVKPTLDVLFGAQDSGWHTVKHPTTGKAIVRKGPGAGH
jgi:hypothetical protein